MNGAQSVVQTLLTGGVELCLANPGTSEMHFVAALDQTEGMRCVLGLHETVVTGMADGYYRIAGKPACTLLHCGPGLANGMANLHNARRARSGIVNIVGDQATYHRPYDAPLTADTEAMARAVSHWVRTSTNAANAGRDAAAALQAAASLQGQVATLILPSDVSWNEGGQVVQSDELPYTPSIDSLAVEQAARILRGRGKVLILLAGNGLSQASQEHAWRISTTTRATLMADYVVGRVSRGAGRLQLERVPYNTDAAIEALKDFDHIILVNAKPPVGFFAYPDKPSTQYASHTQFHVLSRCDQDAEKAMSMLADELGAPPVAIPNAGARPLAAAGVPTPDGLAQTVAALMPEHAIISDESLSFGRSFYPHTHAAPRHDWLHLAGGAIGDGMPVATGAALAGGGRRVINLQADGSAMYSLQSLWTQARERLPVTTIILNNRKYNILIGEYKGVGAVPGPTAMSMLDLSDPQLDWVKLAEGMGVEAAQAHTLEECAALMARSFTQPAPFLIDLLI
ncbi:acetolactate synthase large subunit [Rhizobium leguminosarum]|uniref:acetolactate synthase large subunit n=1 Tax=Rhizobium leguminosarum TaxID=384 RepID=UPI001C942BA0|nr:acetolactate synthase large subunit [Rhizobium leguminosarum]MBY5406438.1 acetolactate synthase large subunit [Rhizobium leguminosarum]